MTNTSMFTTASDSKKAPSATNTPILDIRNLRREFLQGTETVYAVDDVTLTISEGEYVSIIGQSGSGKTTLLNLLGGIDRPTSGEIRICGKPIQKMNDRELCAFRSLHVGFVFQNYNLIPELNVMENIRLPLDIAGKTLDREYMNNLITLLGLEERTYFYPHQLSGGQQQRVAIARALITKPDLILADEPTGNLDKESGDRFLDFIEKTNRDYHQTYIMVTHNPEIANRTKRTITIRDGKVVDDIVRS